MGWGQGEPKSNPNHNLKKDTSVTEFEVGGGKKGGYLSSGGEKFADYFKV